MLPTRLLMSLLSHLLQSDTDSGYLCVSLLGTVGSFEGGVFSFIASALSSGMHRLGSDRNTAYIKKVLRRKKVFGSF